MRRVLPQRVLAVSITERGRAMAGRLPFQRCHGGAAGTVRAEWASVDGFVLFLSVGAAVRIVGPLLADKVGDPAVVCVDEAGRFAVAVCGGHAAGANRLARSVAGKLGAQAVVTTATDATAAVALDDLPGFRAAGDIAGVTRALLDGHPPAIDNELGWPLPATFPAPGAGPARVVVTDRCVADAPGTVVLRPPSLVAGVGASTGAPPEELASLLEIALRSAGLDREALAEVATLDRKRDEPAIVAIAAGLALRTFPAEALAAVSVPHPNEAVRAAVGTPSVAEASALLAAGPGAELVAPKRAGPHATVALARRAGPRGHLSLVGLGPGSPALRTPAAETAVRSADLVIGYGPYLDLCADLLTPTQETLRSPIGEEQVRAKRAVAEAAAGRRVALVCSGDAGVYGMASIALETACDDAPSLEVEVVPGVTAALAAAAIVGAPLGHDHASISLSDLLTPWEAIEARLSAAAAADLVVALYNPRSRARPWQLEAARRVLLTHRLPTTPVAVVTDVARPGERAALTTLGDLEVEQVGMTSCVLVGASTTRVAAGRMVTPRGYRR